MAHRRPKDESSDPGGRDEQPKPVQPSAGEQSGSAGRPAATDEKTQGKDTGQDHYGQSGFAGGNPESETRDARRKKS